MFEDNLYEPIAEIYITLSGQPSQDDIYCLCSRVFVEGSNLKEEEEVQEDLEGVEETTEEPPKSALSIESTVRFCSSSTESHAIHSPKKSHEEAVSCYCSASHYSTDEHDSLRDSVLHHSDSGADLSESSRDLDWERYWTLHGERLIWESWIHKYGSYIDPSYFQSSVNGDSKPAEGDETSFCVQSDKTHDPNRRISFSGVIESCKGSEKSSSFSHQSSAEEKLSEEQSAPLILVEIAKNEGDLLNRRLSDISETAKSISERSEDSLNFDEHDKLRLSVFSRCSGSSAPLSATTDSMTNVTRITLSSSDSSYGVDDSSAKSSSILSSSSASEVDQQWQSLWAEHFNEQYSYHYNKFSEKQSKKKECLEEVKSDSGLIIDDNKLSIKPSEPQHQESIDDVGSIETQDSVSEGEHSKPPSVTTASSKSSSKSDKKYVQKQRLLSVGYLLQQLNAMSMEPSERIEEESSILKPSTIKNVLGASEKALEHTIEYVENVYDKNVDNGDISAINSSRDFSKPILVEVECNKNCEMESNNCVEDISSNCGDAEMQSNPDEDACGTRHGLKRSHENENDVEKVKSAYQLMGFMYDLENTKKIRKASVWYKKRFNQIRFQNRILRLQKPPNKHIYFDDEGNSLEQPPQQENKSVTDENQGKNESGELYLDAAEADLPDNEQEPAERKFEMEDFSEKDDSTDDDQEIFFSAEEDNLLDTSQERRENKLKALPKRRRKRQSKKKSVVNYPQEMIDNPKIKKYWRRRFSLFSKFDDGIKMDTESWFSVTPEKIAINIAERCQCDLVVDAFCGAGGNAIQLAFTCERVIAVDIDPLKIELARNNARVYGVEDRIEFIIGDYLQVAPMLAADVVFLSPPWGGPSYNKKSVFPLSSLQPVSGQKLIEVTLAITDNIAFYLPRNINTHELVECAGAGGSVEVVQNFLDRELVAVTAFFGELVKTIE